MTIQELFSDKSKWTRGDTARNKNGEFVSWNTPSAYCFCLIGAVQVCYTASGRIEEVLTILRNALSVKSNTDLAVWNDAAGRTFEEVVELVKKANV